MPFPRKPFSPWRQLFRFSRAKKGKMKGASGPVIKGRHTRAEDGRANRGGTCALDGSGNGTHSAPAHGISEGGPHSGPRERDL